VQTILISNTSFTFPTPDKAPPTDIKAEYTQYPKSKISKGMYAGKKSLNRMIIINFPKTAIHRESNKVIEKVLSIVLLINLSIDFESFFP
jgi:hypothetical protein